MDTFQVGDQWIFYWSPTWEFSHPEPSADPAGIYLYYLDGTLSAVFPLLFFAHSLLVSFQNLRVGKSGQGPLLMDLLGGWIDCKV